MSAARIAVVTGGNRGIGHEIARQLAKKGLRVLATSRDEEEGRRAARETGAEPYALDVTRPESVAGLAAYLEDGVDVLVNNAGVSLKGFDAEVAHRTLDTNFFGTLRVTDALLPRMRAGGRIVMVSSGLGDLSGVPSADLRARFSDPSLSREALVALASSFVRDVAEGKHAERGWPSSAYRVSKVAMNALVRVLARELGDDPRALRVNTIDPGWVRTRMGGAGAPRSVEQGARTATWLATEAPSSLTGKFFRDEREVPF